MPKTKKQMEKVRQAKKDKSKPDKLTIKERKFVKALVETGNGTEAAQRAYDPGSKKSAQQLAYQVRHRPKVQRAIITALETNELTPDSVIKSLKTNITKGAGVKAKASDANKAIEIYLKLVGAYDNPDFGKTDKQTLKKLEHSELVEEVRRREMITSKLLAEDEVALNE